MYRFTRYMSGIREDGSNITDASRGCTAADYNIWASQFMSDFLYQWDRISDPLWSKSFHNGVTPNQSVEYSFCLFLVILKQLINTPLRKNGRAAAMTKSTRRNKLQLDTAKTTTLVYLLLPTLQTKANWKPS